MLSIFRSTALVLMLCCGGCSAADLVNAATSRSGYEVQHQAYAPGPRHGLDLYVPDTVAPDAPVVVFIYGGGWVSGDKQTYLFAGQAFASRGYITAVPDYRVYPEVRFPDFMDDAAEAVAWVAQHEKTPDGKPRPIILVGHSAGAQIAMLLALDKHYLARQETPVCNTVMGVVGMAGPYDFLPLKQERYKKVFPEKTRPASQAIAFASRDEPPVLLQAGTGDTTVDPGNSRRLADRIREKGGRVELKEYKGVGHAELVGTLAAPLRHVAPTLDDIDAFIKAQAGKSAPFCR
ncbi:Acetyl esterase/lipase [Faunimonas pinastri]|uniref:Acetyl esterase/lipase n=1 Tax=Faunimonas pinastri TaxID=1855383 RepID=A0A1H9GZP2_9HYPH|nr:alpha/beta hydrolase [Faunimonas pinastri]SEQ55524.1 Acetyl esterase/lipase [Faunimonas pinastri]